MRCVARKELFSCLSRVFTAFLQSYGGRRIIPATLTFRPIEAPSDMTYNLKEEKKTPKRKLSIRCLLISSIELPAVQRLKAPTYRSLFYCCLVTAEFEAVEGKIGKKKTLGKLTRELQEERLAQPNENYLVQIFA